MATKQELEAQVAELQATIAVLEERNAGSASSVDEGYHKALVELLDNTELQHPRVFRGFGWRNCL